MEITLAFVLGMISSGIIAILYDYATRPRLKALIDEARAQGQLPQNPAHEFYHVKVRNLPAAWDILPPIISRILPGPRPAWSCKATIQVFNSDGSVAIQDVIQARWPSQPEPIQQFLPQGQLVNVVDLPKLMAARKVDVHGHDDQPICIALKYEGEPDCYIFTNESYFYPRWQNPSWRLQTGSYRVQVSIFYESGLAQGQFELSNSGPSRNDLRLTPWPQS